VAVVDDDDDRSDGKCVGGNMVVVAADDDVGVITNGITMFVEVLIDAAGVIVEAWGMVGSSRAGMIRNVNRYRIR
jgi:hypothetical protein